MGLSTEQQILIEQRVTNDGPSTGVAYLLWFFLGLVSGHRWYLGRGGSAIAQIISYFFMVGLIWWIVDGFLIPGMIREKRQQVRDGLMLRMMATETAPPAAPPIAATA